MTTLPNFEITIQDNSTWFAITEGELTGMMFRMAEDVPAQEDGGLALAYDFAFNRLWEGGEERAELMKPQICKVIETFIEIAMEECAKQIEAGDLKMNLEEAHASL